MEKNRIDPQTINGWGIDADPENDPTYPIKNRTNEDQKGYSTWDRPPQQINDVEVLKSTERPNLSAVIGTSTPPSGLSGQIRRYAYKYPENQFRRWLPLILADRINVYEGILDDLKHGHIPNIFAERGWNAEWKHNREGAIKKIAAAVVVTTAVVAWLVLRKSDSRK